MKKSQMSKDDKKYIWHPFTQMLDYERESPLIISKGKGNYLFDIDGKRYFDGVSSLWVTVHGHRDPDMDKALKDQISDIAHSTLLGLSHPSAIDAAKGLIAIAPANLKKVFFSDNGSTAVEVALKMAFQYWQQKKGRGSDALRFRRKKKFISFSGAYHGDTIGSVSVGGIDLFHQIYKPLLFDSIKVPYPFCYRCPYGKGRSTCSRECVSDMKKIIARHARRAAAVIIEPLVQGASGIVTAPKGYLREVSRACKKYDVLLIADEVATGFGRTGKMFACNHENVKPDLMSLAKGITGGYLPLAATLATDEIYNAFKAPYNEFKTFFHGHTYTGNPLAARCAVENIRLFKKRKILSRIRPKIRHLARELKTLSHNPHVGDIRQCGLMAGIEIVKAKLTKEAFPPAEKIGIRICREARALGVILRPLGNVIVLMPSLRVSLKEIQMLIRVVHKAIDTALGVPD